MRDMRAASLSGGIWRLRHILQGAAGYELVRWPRLLGPDAYDVVVGWGHKRTAASARRLAVRRAKPYVAIEDGWIRSLRPGRRELPRSLVVDRTGIYYDAARPSDLERSIAASAGATDVEATLRAERGMARLRSEAVSKYNDAPRRDARALGLRSPIGCWRVLVVDQTYGDASVAGGGADERTFVRMLAAARAENPGAEILVKVHPEVVSGRKQGYLAGRVGASDGVRVIPLPVNPWSLIEQVHHVYVVSSQLGFEALMAGVPVSCFGAPFYAGWGLTDDRLVIPRRTARPSLAEVFAAAYLDYAIYAETGSGQRLSFEASVDQIIRDRRRMLSEGSACAWWGWRAVRGRRVSRSE
jgi:capsular polysaccharide export protein